jgi:hypothetical protein
MPLDPLKILIHDRHTSGSNAVKLFQNRAAWELTHNGNLIYEAACFEFQRARGTGWGLIADGRELEVTIEFSAHFRAKTGALYLFRDTCDLERIILEAFYKTCKVDSGYLIKKNTMRIHSKTPTIKFICTEYINVQAKEDQAAQEAKAAANKSRQEELRRKSWSNNRQKKKLDSRNSVGTD